MTAPVHGLAVLLVSVVITSAVLAGAASPPFQAGKLSVKSAVNQKAFETWAVKGAIAEQFSSIQHCLPIAITLSVNSSFTDSASITVNSTSLESSYNVQPYVESGNLRLALNGTVRSQDLVNVTIQLPPAWAVALFNATVTGSGYVNYQLGNVTLPKLQLQLSGAGFANMNNTANSLVVNADTNASFVGNGTYGSLAMNWASSGAAIVSRATQAAIQKSGSGNVYIPKAIKSLQLVQTGKGVASFAEVDTATVLQTGSGGLFLGIATGANISYAGGKNTTYIQANGTAGGVPTVADIGFTTTGNGTLVFSAAPGVAYPALSVNGAELNACLNVSKWSNKACNESALLAIPLAPEFPPKTPKCKPPATWVLTDSDACYVNPLDGWQCQAIAPVNGGQTFAMVLVLLGTAVILIWVNNL